jgi:hypothetical protein
MEVEAIYENGRLEFVQPLRLKHSRVRMTVILPDDEVDTGAPYDMPPQVVAHASAAREALDAILNAPVSAEDAFAELTEKEQDRMAAFALREDR